MALKIKEFCKKHTDGLLAGVFLLLLFGVLAIRYDFYFDLNDDVLMKDILSGVYTGTPEGRNMQMLYPLGLLISLFYFVLEAPVYGTLLFLAQAGALWIVLSRTLSVLKKLWIKIAVLLTETLFFFCALGYYLVNVQYTVTSGLLAAAAVFWFMTVPDQKNPLDFIRKNLTAIVLSVVSFCLRTEMFLLLLPLLGVAGLCRWSMEKKIFTKENWLKYCGVLGSILFAMVLCLAVDHLAYSSFEWQDFRTFFDERTELYDYQKDVIDNYEENKEVYDAAGVTASQWTLLSNYNFGIEDEIDSTLLGSLKEAALTRPGADSYFKVSASDALWNLRNRHLFGMQDMPLNYAFLGLFLALILISLKKGRRKVFFQALTCMGAGIFLWMFLLLRGRTPERITVPLYFCGILILTGLLFWQLSEDKKKNDLKAEESGKNEITFIKKELAAFLAAVFGLILVLVVSLQSLPDTLKKLDAKAAERRENDRINEAVMDYCDAHEKQLFLADVYSTVSFSEKLFEPAKAETANYDLLGGWLVKSPLTVEKLRQFGYASMEEAVKSGENVRLLSEKEQSMDWLTDYFMEQGIEIRILKVDTIADAMDVYQAVPVSSETGLTTIE